MRRDILSALRTVLSSPRRLRALVADDPFAPLDLVRFLVKIVPEASWELAQLRAFAETIPDERLRTEALASVEHKAFHVAGASILATFLPAERATAFVQIVTPLETIYDYLDNLCDRHPDVEAQAYPVLHQAIADALDPNATPRNYYALGPSGDDGGYLRMLVETTQNRLREVPHLDVLRPLFAEAARFYAELQTYKHLPPGEREVRCVRWYEEHRERFADLDWHEFACACGSNMQVFAALFAAFDGRETAIEPLYHAYFPYISSLHIMLDSFIDQDEDREHDDLNFVAVYGSAADLRRRTAFLTARARERLAPLARAGRHRFVLDVMTLFYLSHPQVAASGLEREAQRLLRANA